MRLQKQPLSFYSLTDITKIAYVNGPKITSWEEFHKDLKNLDLVGDVFALNSVDFSKAEPMLKNVLGETLTGNSVTSEDRIKLFNEYGSYMQIADPMVTTWFVLDMWCLSTSQLMSIGKVDNKKVTNGDILIKLMQQRAPLYKPRRMSWSKFWKLCIIEMQASRHYYE